MAVSSPSYIDLNTAIEDTPHTSNRLRIIDNCPLIHGAYRNLFDSRIDFVQCMNINLHNFSF